MNKLYSDDSTADCIVRKLVRIAAAQTQIEQIDPCAPKADAIGITYRQAHEACCSARPWCDTDRLFRRPPFPPPAQRCALTWVLSSATSSGGSGDPATVSKICCQIPRPLQRLKRLYTVVYGPYSGGQSCQRHPVLSTCMILLKIRRLFRGFWPGRFIGMRGLIFAHCSSFNQNKLALIGWPPESVDQHIESQHD